MLLNKTKIKLKYFENKYNNYNTNTVLNTISNIILMMPNTKSFNSQACFL